MHRHKFSFHLASYLGIFLALIVAAVCFSGSAIAKSPAASPLQSIAQFDQPDLCETAWGPEPAPDPGSAYNTALYTMDAVSANDIWAVGRQRDNSNGNSKGYVTHWNGTNWTTIPSVAVGEYTDTYNSVAAIASNNVWVVGYSCGQSPCTTLIERWNGSAFAVVSSPNVASASNQLYDIVAISANNVWAVGASTPTSTHITSPLTLHWNGSIWSIVNTPNLGSQKASLSTVTAINSNDIWALGNYFDSNGHNLNPIALHWNGTAWNVVNMPVPAGSVDVTVNGSAALASNNVWAIGNYKDYIQDDIRSLAYHWNGTAWSLTPIPYSADFWQFEYLNDISALSANDIWAVGYLAESGSEDPLFMHWNGSAWTMLPRQYTSDDDGLGGVVMISPTDAWAVGYENHRDSNRLYSRPIIQRFRQRCFTPSPIPSPGPTDTRTPTYTRTPTFTPSPTATYTPEPPRCPGQRFTDVCPGDYFFDPVIQLNNAAIVSGYTTSPPCETSLHIPCFKPYNGSSRGQISKIVSLAAGFTEPVSGQSFQDVLPGDTFYQYIERMASRQIITGYPCGNPGEPCGPFSLPYFRTVNPVTRGQLTKMVASAFNFTEPVSGQPFEDVAIGSTFYTFIGRIAARGIINGYPCSGPGEQCIPPDNRPYFRPGNGVTRGQTAKIVYLSMTQPTATATAIPTATQTQTPTYTPTDIPTLSPTITSTSTPTPLPTETSPPPSR